MVLKKSQNLFWDFFSTKTIDNSYKKNIKILLTNKFRSNEKYNEKNYCLIYSSQTGLRDFFETLFIYKTSLKTFRPNSLKVFLILFSSI